MTLSERHIKAYDDDAPADPPAHKDRLSSQVSVGLSIDIPEDSTLVLYPDDYRDVNRFNVSPDLRASLLEEELPENCLGEAREIVIPDKPGDVVMFGGSSMWHKRRNAASATNLYLKFTTSARTRSARTRPPSPAARARCARSRAARSPTARQCRRPLDTVSRATTREPGRTSSSRTCGARARCR
jgi:hypothetical protein